MTDPWPGLHAGAATHRSTDGGQTWGDSVWLSGVPGIEPFHESLGIPVAVRGNILELGDGRLVVSAYGFDCDNTSYLFQSIDQGQSWTFHSTIATGFNESYLHETPGGDLIVFMRAWGDRVDHIHISRSPDGGLTWAEPESLCLGYPATCAFLGSGNLLITYGYRFEEGFGVRARMMASEATDLAEEELIIRDDGAVSDLGYPHAVSLPDGRVFVTYYVNRQIDAPDKTAPRYIEACIVSE
jgi:hypothetical protein